MKTLIGVLVPLLAMAAPALADNTERFSFGGDRFVAGQTATIDSTADNDAFATGFNVDVTTPVAGDAHAAGFTVSVSGPVEGNVYAAGMSVSVAGAIGRDLTAVGNTVNLTGPATIAGNVRAAGASVVLDRPVSGSAMLAGASVTIDAPISGDLFLSADSVSFGDNARVDGMIDIRATEPIEVPERVAPADRVQFTRIEPAVIAGDAKGIIDGATKGVGFAWIGGVLGALAVIIYGAILLAIFPRRAEIGYLTAMEKPWKSLLFGVLAAAVYAGLIPVLGATLIGIPLIPFALILLALAALTGFVAGTYFVADRVLGALNYDADTLWKRIGALVIGLIAVWILGIVPFLGWLVQFGLGLFGLGALSFSAIGRRLDTGFHHRIADQTATIS